LKVPAAQLVQLAAPAEEILPSEHGVHAVALALAANVPAPHLSHEEDEGELLKLPGAQGEHLAEAPAPANEPVAQGEQEPAPAVDLKVPALQLAQTEAVPRVSYLPGAQSAQPTVLPAAENFPAAQGEHTAELALKKPARQLSGLHELFPVVV